MVQSDGNLFSVIVLGTAVFHYHNPFQRHGITRSTGRMWKKIRIILQGREKIGL